MFVEIYALNVYVVSLNVLCLFFLYFCSKRDVWWVFHVDEEWTHENPPHINTNRRREDFKEHRHFTARACMCVCACARAFSFSPYLWANPEIFHVNLTKTRENGEKREWKHSICKISTPQTTSNETKGSRGDPNSLLWQQMIARDAGTCHDPPPAASHKSVARLLSGFILSRQSCGLEISAQGGKTVVAAVISLHPCLTKTLHVSDHQPLKKKVLV